MNDPDNSPPTGKGDWQGFREVDRAIAENRQMAYTWKKAWADPWERKALIFATLLVIGFVVFVAIYDGLI